jgi:L-ascorbate metabolism protein UlaG (beta-lactamase superfamily)
MAQIHFHGHATFTLTTDDGTRILIDPFFDENPAADVSVADVSDVDFIFVTHGHFDHFGDAVSIGRRTGATMVAGYEIVEFLQTQGIENAHPMSVGGSWAFPFGRTKMTIAVHGSGVYTGEAGPPLSTTPGGFLFDLGPGQRIYFSGDTALTLDMKLLEGRVDVAVLPVGDNFTMGPEDALKAIEFIGPSIVIPCHYGTWPYVEIDIEAFVSSVGDLAEVVLLGEGQRAYDF